MLPASNRGVGMNFGFPDVCLTPTPVGPVPIPYPNFALNAQAVAFSPIVSVSGVNALNMGTKIPMTFGDDAGTAHPVFKQMGQYIMGNPIVKVDRLPAICLACPTMGNAANNAVGAVIVPSAVNVFYTYADPPKSALTPEEAASFGDAILGRGAESPILVSMLDDAVALVQIRVFTTDLPSRFFAALQSLEAAGARALVLDLRGCPGGDLDAAITWASEFLPEGAEIAQIEDEEGDLLVKRAAMDGAYKMPVALLIDGKTASAAEVFAACMKAHRRAILLGQRTYGKGSAQRVVPGEQGGFAYTSAARCFGPAGALIEGIGVDPDIALTSDEDGLDMAASILRAQII